MRSRFPLVLAAAALVAGLGVSSPAKAEEPPVRYPPSYVRPRLIAGGLLLTGVAYGAAFLGSEAALNWPGAQELKAPIIGPWWTLALNGCPKDDPGCDAFVYLRAGLLVVDGLMQAAGLALVAEAIVMKTEAVAPAPAKKAASAWNFSLTPAPIVTPTMTGVGFVGTF
ncbi:MAG: hypothetical protein R3B70_05515 [Polyangiaceae bacterium]